MFVSKTSSGLGAVDVFQNRERQGARRRFFPVLFKQSPAASALPLIILHAVRNEAVNPRSRAPALERNALEAPASCENPGRLEPPKQRVPRQEPRNKDIKSDHLKYKSPIARGHWGRTWGSRSKTIFQLADRKCSYRNAWHGWNCRCSSGS